MYIYNQRMFPLHTFICLLKYCLLEYWKQYEAITHVAFHRIYGPSSYKCNCFVNTTMNIIYLSKDVCNCTNMFVLTKWCNTESMTRQV